MIYYITNRKIDFVPDAYRDITIVTSDKITSLFKEVADENELLGYDLETHGLDPYQAGIHLYAIGTEDINFIFDAYSVDILPFIQYIKENNTIIGHGLKFDIKHTLVKTNILLDKVYDTMIAEQRLYMKLGLRFGLDKLTYRYLNYLPSAMDKNIRVDFINNEVGKLHIKPKHIYYAAGDIKHLFKIKEKQEEKIEKYDLGFLLYEIEFPLISVLSKAEVKGIDFDIERWQKLADENIQKKYETELAMDEFILKYIKDKPEVRKYIDITKITNRPKKALSLSQFAKEIGQVDLFGNPSGYEVFKGKTLKSEPKIPSHHYNYGSDAQIVELFGRLQEPLITEGGSFIVPKFNNKGKIDKSIYKFRTGEDKLEAYLKQFPNSKMRPFINLLLEHRKYSTRIDTFGYSFIDKINPVSGKLHTIYRQCRAVTGRFQSGGGRSEPDKFNSQNIPAIKDYRNCFIAGEGYSIGTHDYSGAELILMCSFSNDKKLYQLGVVNDDIHSPIAQLVWRKIFTYRASKLKELIKDHNEESALYKEYIKYLNFSKTYIVSKKENKDVRTAFKPNTFGTIYGMYDKKAAESNHVSLEEGRIIIDTIKKEFPLVFKMVESKTAFASKYGYIILNKRTKSRAWFPNIIRHLRGEISLKDNFAIISGEKNEARNLPIQGTQADFIKEATVELDKWIVDNGYNDEISLLMWIHDEIVDRHPKYLDGKSEEWKKWSEEGNTLSWTTGEKTYTFNNFPELKKCIMEQVADRYLENGVTISVDYDVEDYWTK